MVPARLDRDWCGGSEVLFISDASPSREFLNLNHTRIIVFQCSFESEVRLKGVLLGVSELRIRNTGPQRRKSALGLPQHSRKTSQRCPAGCLSAAN